MKISHFANYESMSDHAATLVLQEIDKKKDLLICAATGQSPLGLYKVLGEKSESHSGIFKEIRIIKLDEWGDVPMDHQVSCENYIVSKLIQPLSIRDSHYISFDSLAEDPKEECERIQKELRKQGPIDLCILGIGINGHLGFNEPADFLIPHCHTVLLSKESLAHDMIRNLDKKPEFGYTIGMGDILNSKKILLLITGKGKQDIVEKLMKKRVRTHIPATFLWLHHNVECFIDDASFMDMVG